MLSALSRNDKALSFPFQFLHLLPPTPVLFFLLQVPCDSSRDSDIAAAIGRIRDESGRLDILVRE